MNPTALSIITQSSEPIDIAGRNSEPILIENGEHHWDDIFTLEDFEALLQYADLPADHVHVFYRGKNINTASKIPEAIREVIPRIEGRYDNDRLFRAYSSNGCSIRIINAYKFHPKINEMMEKLLDETRIMVSANIYYSPSPEQRILPLHRDAKEVYISQISGKKRMFFAEKTHANENPAIDDISTYIAYSAGDNLYIPRGVPHCGQSLDGHSLHLTWGFRAHSISRFLQYVLARDEPLNVVLKQPIGLSQSQEPDYEALEKLVKELQKTIGRALRDKDLLNACLQNDRIACDL